MKQKLFCLHVGFAGMRISGVAAHTHTHTHTHKKKTKQNGDAYWVWKCCIGAHRVSRHKLDTRQASEEQGTDTLVFSYPAGRVNARQQGYKNGRSEVSEWFDVGGRSACATVTEIVSSVKCCRFNLQHWCNWSVSIHKLIWKTSSYLNFTRRSFSVTWTCFELPPRKLSSSHYRISSPDLPMGVFFKKP